MKKILALLFIISFIIPSAFGQLSFSNKRERDKLYNEGLSKIQSSEFVEASELFSRCIEIDSTYSPAYLQRARISIEEDLDDAAMIDLDRALTYDRELGEAYFYKAYLLFDADTSGQTTELLNAAIQKGFNDPYAFYFLGLAKLRDGQSSEAMNDEAMNDFTTAISLKPDFALAYHDRAGIKREKGDLQGALYDYKTSVDYDPGFALAYNNMGSVKIIMGDYEGGINDFTKAVELDPDLFLAYNNRGCAKYHMGEYESALEDFNLAVLLNGSFSAAAMNKANSLAKQSDYAVALELLDETLESVTDDPLLFLNRGLIRELTGDKRGACSDWQTAFDLGYTQAEEYLKECN